MVKMKDIAKACGYSMTTVSKAFNDYSDISEEAKRLVLDTAERLGYVPNANARTLATKKSNTIGIIYDEILGFGIRHPFFGSVIEYFKEAVEKEGYDIMFISKEIKELNIKSYLDHCRQRGVDGVFIAYTNYESPGIKALLDSEIPSVCVENQSEKTNCVNSDNFQGSYQAVEYLYSLGHRKIAHIAGTHTGYAGREREAGYLMALQDKTLDVRKEYIVSGGHYTYEGGYDAMKTLMALSDLPSGVVVAGDMMALGAVKCVLDNGKKVPDDFSILGFDNIDILNYTVPGISSVAQNVKMLGKKAAEILIQNIKQPGTKKREIILSTSIVERESCKKI